MATTAKFYFSDLQQVLSQGGRDGFGAVGGAYFREQRREVFAHARNADSELFGDVFIGEAAGYRFEHFR